MTSFKDEFKRNKRRNENTTHKRKLADQGLCTSCEKNSVSPKSRWHCLRCIKARQRRDDADRYTAITHYGSKCNCKTCPGGCNVTNFRHLQLDHVNNDGAKHKLKPTNKRRLTSADLARWAIRNNFPATLQVLCANCNQAKEHYGGCS